jgi:hypothetical protein
MPAQVCAHPYLFLAGQQPPYEPDDPEELVRASGKLAALDNILPKLRATGAHALLPPCVPLCSGFFPGSLSLRCSMSDLILARARMSC